jgi:hypothetical protein
MDILDIVKYANKQSAQSPLHARLVDIYSGNFIQYIQNSLKEELSPESYKVASQRIPVINLLERITKKLSKVYSDEPRRTTNDDSDSEILNEYSDNIEIQSVMQQADTLLNLTKCFALEPYLKSGLFEVRVLAPSEFCVYSDDKQNPKSSTALVKFMGSYPKGKHNANLYWVYTNELFVIVDSDGEILDSQNNPYGVVPFVYCSSDSFNLQPQPDLDSFHTSLIVPKLLCDLAYSTRFMSHSLLYAIDCNISSNLTNGPDVFWSLNSTEGENKRPQIGSISPSVDVDKVLALIAFTLSQWLESKGIKPGTIGTMQPSNAASAVSKIVDEADASSVINRNRQLLVTAEKSLWHLIGIIHNTLLGSDKLSIEKGLSAPFNVSVAFPVQQPIQDPAERRNELKFQLDNKLISYMRALKQAHPDLTEEEILKLKEEIDAEKQPAPGIVDVGIPAKT